MLISLFYQGLGLRNRRLVKDGSVRPTTETIEWSQISRCWWSCSEEYRLVDYYIDGDTSRSVYKVFVAKETTPPNEFRTSGYRDKLHFGFLTFGSDDGAMFFVIHPNSWGPYQHRFKTNAMTSFFKFGTFPTFNCWFEGKPTINQQRPNCSC